MVPATLARAEFAVATPSAAVVMSVWAAAITSWVAAIRAASGAGSAWNAASWVWAAVRAVLAAVVTVARSSSAEVFWFAASSPMAVCKTVPAVARSSASASSGKAVVADACAVLARLSVVVESCRTAARPALELLAEVTPSAAVVSSDWAAAMTSWVAVMRAVSGLGAAWSEASRVWALVRSALPAAVTVARSCRARVVWLAASSPRAVWSCAAEETRSRARLSSTEAAAVEAWAVVARPAAVVAWVCTVSSPAA